MNVGSPASNDGQIVDGGCFKREIKSVAVCCKKSRSATFGKGASCGKKGSCIYYSLRVGLWKVTRDASVMVKSRSNVPHFFAMWTPGLTLRIFHMRNNFCTWRCKRCFIIVEFPMDECMCRKIWIETSRA